MFLFNKLSYLNGSVNLSVTLTEDLDHEAQIDMNPYHKSHSYLHFSKYIKQQAGEHWILTVGILIIIAEI